MTTQAAPDALKEMLAPGQDDLLAEFLQEQEAAPDENPLDQFLAEQEQGEQPADDGLPEKFRGKSAAEIAAAYQELEKKLGQRVQQQEPAGPKPDEYTPELGQELYGETVASAIAAAEINPLEMAAKVEAGQDVSSYVDALVEKGGLPRNVVETYLQGVAPPQPAAAGEPAGLSDADVVALKAQVGGEAQFNQLSQWAASNLSPAELSDYNAAVDSGNKTAVAWALRAMQARAGASSEPKLISGGDPPSGGMSFESMREITDAMNATDNQGRRRYEVDEKYRKAVEAGVARAKFL